MSAAVSDYHTATNHAANSHWTEVDLAERQLRRAPETSRAATYLHIVIEASLTGASGGVLGVYLGKVTAAIVSAANRWPITTSLALVSAGTLV